MKLIDLIRYNINEAREFVRYITSNIYRIWNQILYKLIPFNFYFSSNFNWLQSKDIEDEIKISFRNSIFISVMKIYRHSFHFNGRD